MQSTIRLNNISERGVRPLKIQQKISGRLASDDVTQDRLDIRGYIDTVRKHGKNAMDVLHNLMLGQAAGDLGVADARALPDAGHLSSTAPRSLPTVRCTPARTGTGRKKPLNVWVAIFD